MLLTLLALVEHAATATSAAQARTTLTLTHDWRFQRGDLRYNGGPVLCADDLTAAFPSDLAGKECAMGPARDAWSMITSGGYGAATGG